MLLAALRSAAVARAILIFLALFGAGGAWAPWVQPDGPPAPAWATALWLDHPFSSPWFLLGVALLFASTLACTWGRRARIARWRRGELPGGSLMLEGEAAGLAAFLRAQGFRGKGPLLRRYGLALWAGWVLHVGLLLLIAGVLVQQALHDGGTFLVTEGELLPLQAPGAVFMMERGLLATRETPPLSVALEAFDPARRQPGYAPDRLSTLRVIFADGRDRLVTLDRAAGAEVEGVVIHQAIRTGPSLVLEVAGQGRRALALQSRSRREAAIEVADQAGRPARFALSSERDLDDPRGIGQILVRLERDDGPVILAPGAAFDFGGPPARILAVSRWASFTYARSPGMPGVLAGVAVILAGCLLLVFPAGVARLQADGAGGATAHVHLPRGASVLEADWKAAG